MIRHNILLVLLIVGLVTSRTVMADDEGDPVLEPTVCGRLANAYGPFDYNDPPPNSIPLVEGAHFQSEMDALNGGKVVRSDGAFIWGGFDYTLRAFPNHPGALMAIDRLSLRMKSDKPRGAQKSAHCYFIRAIAFKPTDGTVRMLYGLYLLRRDRPKEAVVQLTKAEKYVGESANLHYNLGLAYYQLRDYAKSQEHARIAYDLGFPLPGLRDMLGKRGMWPPPEGTSGSKVEKNAGTSQ